MELEGKLLIATISAFSAIAGAVISQVVTVFRDWLNKKHQRNVLLRTKFEEFADLITNSQEWVSNQYNITSFKEFSDKPPIQARKAMVISYIYFPKLREQSEKYMNSCVALQKVMVENFEARNSAAIEKPLIDLKECRQNLDRLIIDCANIYAKA